LIVVPPKSAAAVRTHPLLQALRPLAAGVFPLTQKHEVRRATGLAETVLILCQKGRGWFETPTSRGTVTAGEVLFLSERLPHSYGGDPDDPWAIEWVHFSGTEGAAWLTTLGVKPTQPVLRLRAEAAAKLTLAGVYGPLADGYDVARLVAAAAALRGALAEMLRGQTRGEVSRSAHEAVRGSAEWMRQHLAQPAQLSDLARRAGLSVPHYAAMFRQVLGYAPIDYWLRLRVQRACEQLVTTDRRVAEVAESLGFNDPFYFARQFRRVMGASPREYRQQRQA
jgi:AraC-like DNA-binding protein